MATGGLKMIKLSTKDIALTALFAALITIITRLPGLPIALGVRTGQIEFSVPLYPLAGLLLGPWVGAIAVIIGNFIAWIIPNSTIMGLLLIPAGAFAALVTGFLTRTGKYSNWKFAAVILTILDLSWYATPIGGEAPFYPIPLHFTSLALILIFRGKISEYINSSSRRLVSFGVGIASFIGIMADHMWGGIMFITAFNFVVDLKLFRDSLKAIGMIWVKLGLSSTLEKNLPPWLYEFFTNPTLGNFFMLSIPIAAIERIVFTIIASVVGVAIIRTLGGKLFSFKQPNLKERDKSVS